MARSRSAASQTRTAESEYREIIAWYERELERAAPPTDLRWEPIKIGPTWRYENGWVLPAATLGWRNLAWAGMHLRDKHGKPWTYTLEQARLILWLDALDVETGQFLHPTSVFQRLKGHGKDPIASCVSATDICSEDAVFSHWNGDIPVGMQQPNAWVQIVAVSQVQTQNTMKLFPSLIPADTRKKYGIQIGKLNVWARGDEAQIEAVTSNPLTIEGGRPTRIVRNETQNWNTSNGGHAMAGAIEGNAAKSEGGAARILDICNAYRPGEDSVGQKVREAFDATQGSRCKVHADFAPDDWPECIDCQRPKALDFGLLYDSLEAPPEAPLTAEAAPSVIEAIRGDSVWLNTRRIVQSILNSTNSASESRRKWYNQITAAEDAWADPKDIKAGERDFGLEPGDKIVMFGDGSKSDDATGLVGVRVSDGHAQVLHVQQPKKGEIVDRDAVDHAVIQTFDTYKVVAFWFDPSHARDDDAEGDNRFWWPLCDEWSKRYGRKLKCWPVKSGNKTHAVAFDMATETNQKTFVEGAEQVAGEMDGQAADPESATVTFKKSQWLVEHLGNAKQAPGKHGISVRKDNRESRHKIDLAVCLIGARMLRRIYLLSIKKGTPGKGRVIVMDD
jgi:bifunctional DNA-binding transcriptional regulator/antitoxin component of YhaV-PrlF toxin-antitoxin module